MTVEESIDKLDKIIEAHGGFVGVEVFLQEQSWPLIDWKYGQVNAGKLREGLKWKEGVCKIHTFLGPFRVEEIYYNGDVVILFGDLL